MSNIRRGGGTGGGAPAVPTPTPSAVPQADDDPYNNPEFEPNPVPPVNNGGTLEACETNVFALIELSGLKWRCYMTPTSAPRGVHLSQDDVLRAYGKCLQDGITCTWRRKPPTSLNTGIPEPLQIPSFTNHINKELWVFWYANEPEKLATHCAKLEHVTAEDIGDGSSPPITYEVRILYFKAIHTRIEHSLLKSGMVRLGRWFAKPLPAHYMAKDFTTPRFIEGVSFNFFVHGGNLVCVAVSAERKPALIKLGMRHLESKKRVKVILAPWSLKGEIVPIDEKSDQFLKTQAQQASTLDEFKQFFTFPVPVIEKKKKRRRIIESDDSDCDPSTAKPRKPEIEESGSEESEESSSSGEEYDTTDSDSDFPKSSDGEPETEVESEPESVDREYKPSKKPMPEMVTVEVAGVRFQWPTALVCLTLEHDMEAMNEAGDRNVHSIHISEEARVDDVRKRNELSLDECTTSSFVQGILQTANIPIKRNPAVPPTPVGEFVTPYVAQADDDTKWNNMDPGRTEKCGCTVEHVMKDCHHSDEQIAGWNSKECDEDTSEFFDTIDKCAANHRQHPSNSKPVGYRRKEESIPKPPLMFPKEGTKEKEEADQEIQDEENPTWGRCDNPEEDPIENQTFHDLQRAGEDYIPEAFTPIGAQSPCSGACVMPSVSAEQELPEETFAQIYKPGKQSKVPATAPQKERADDYDYYFNPFMRNEPEFKSYHNRRIGEKRRASYPPPLPLPVPQSPEQPGSQETIPATSSPPPELVLPETTGKLMMSRSVTFPKLKLQEREDEILPRTRKLQRKVYEIESDEENTEEEPREDSDDESPDDGFGEMPGYNSFYPCDDFDEEDVGLPSTFEFEVEKTETDFGEHVSSDEPMETDGAMDNILSPPASNEQYQPLSLKATGPPSVPDANQIYPTPPSVLEANQFSPAGFPMTTMGTTHLHAPPVPSQLVATEEGIKEHEPMEVECMEVVEKHTQKKLAALEVAEHVLPDHTKINGYFSKILQTVISPKNSPQVEKNITTVINRFSLEKKKDNTEELLPIDYYKLAKQLANRPQKPSIEVPISAPHTVGSSSNKINMVPLNHENRSQSDSSKAYQVSFTSIPNPMMQQHPMGFPYHRPGMQVRPGYGPPGGYGAYGATGMPYGGPMGMPNYGPMSQSAMGMPGGYPHMASPLYNPMNAMGSMGGPMNSGPMGHMPMSGGMGHGPMSNPMMGNMGPMSGGPMMNQMNPMGMNAPMNAYQQHQMQQRHMMQMQMQHPQMGPPMNPMGPPMNPWDQPMGMMAPQISSPVIPMAPPLGMGLPMNQQCGVGGPGPFQNQAPPPQPVQPVQQLQEPRPPSPPALPTVGYQMTLGHMDMLPLRYRYLPGPKKVPKTVALNERLAPEASSIVLTIILQDTLLDLHYDICFDACPLCSCNVTIKTRELGLYLIPPEVLRRPAPMQMNLPPYSGFYSSQNQNCNCGFSAVRHRYLSMYNGLFPEDAQEATGVGPKEAITPALGPYHGYDPKSLSIPKYILDSTVNSDRAVMNQLRIMCLKSYVGRTINSLATTAEDMEKAFAPEDDRGIPGSNSEFIMSYVDQTELLLLGNSAVDAALSPLRGPDRKDVSYATFFHPWGLQVANELQVGDEDEALISSVCEKLKPILDESMKIVRDTNTLEGPLIWRDLSKMRQQVSTKTEELDLSHVVEPVPMVCAVLDRELHHFAPSMLALWEETGLGPVDAPKDILYLAVIPDNAEVHAQTLKYMENLSSQYERLKFGKHIALCYDDVRDGIIRAGGRGRPGTKYHNNTFNFLDIVDKEVQDKTVIARLRLFTQQMEEAVAIVLDKNDCLFNREEFRRQIAQEYRAKKQKLSSTASACEKKMEQEARDRGELVEEEVVIATPPPPSTAPAPAKKGGKKEKEPEPVKDDTPGASTERRSSCLEELLNATPDTSVPPANPAALNATVDPPLEPEEIPQDDYVALPHIICIYVVNPFSWDHESRTAVNARIAMTAIIRTYNAICARIKQQNRTQLMLELIELKEVTDYNGCIANLVDNHRGFGNPKIQTWKNNRDNDQFLDDHSPQDDVLDHCWSIYTAPRIGTPEVVRAVQSRFMTKCGPGYSLFNQINEWQRVMPQMLYNIPSCPYFLVQKPRTELSAGGDKIIYRSPDEYVLFMNYCLVGGDYLVATVTDELGRINQSVVINMKPNLKGHQGNYRFKNHTQIRDAMAKLMVFVHGIITLDIKSVRLVIGRLGKMGHGEFKAWTYLLSKTYLRKLSNKPKDGCKPCHETEGAAGMPNIIAACCISFEAEPYVKVFPKLFDPNDKAVKVRNKITTPGEISATHIMVFTVNTNIDLASREDSGNEHNMDTDDFDMDFGDGLGLGNEFDSIMEDVSNTNIDGSNEAPGRIGSLRSGTIDMSVFDHTSMESIQNQPLATGFYISTAPAKDLPDWFWSSCPQAKRKLPNHFKASLHINNQNIGLDDEDITAVTEKKTEKPKNEQIDSSHPLDSNRTDAVLRYVLETYNQLSWLNIDRVSMDRVSCLPIHVQNLLRLYHAVARVYL